jgi:hypothetical protein
MDFNPDKNYINRRIKVKKVEKSIDSFKEVVTFEEKWFTMKDTLVNQRTNNKYHIDILYQDGYRMAIMGYDEYPPFDIKEGDLFYSK